MDTVSYQSVGMRMGSRIHPRKGIQTTTLKFNQMKNLIKYIDKLPSSISQLYYDDTELFKYLMGAFVWLTALGGFKIASLAFAGVYIFRDFHKTRQQYFHYASAVIGITVLGWQLFGWYASIPVALALGGAALVHRWKKHIFVFEVITGVPLTIGTIINIF